MKKCVLTKRFVFNKVINPKANILFVDFTPELDQTEYNRRQEVSMSKTNLYVTVKQSEKSVWTSNNRIYNTVEAAKDYEPMSSDDRSAEAELQFANDKFIKDWHAANADLLDPVIEDFYASSADKESIRIMLYNTESYRVGAAAMKRKSMSAEFIDEAASTFINAKSDIGDDIGDDFISDDGGIEAKVGNQVRASISTGNQEMITKASSVYEDGGDAGLVRITFDYHGNDQLFVSPIQEVAMLAAEDRNAKAMGQAMYNASMNRRNGYIRNEGQEDAVRVAGEVEKRNIAISLYENYAALIANGNKFLRTAYITNMVRYELELLYGSQYIYKYCKFSRTLAGIQDSPEIFDTVFHKAMYNKHIVPAKAAEARNAYLHLAQVIDTCPASSEKQLAWLIFNRSGEMGLDVSKITDGLDYAWNHKDLTDSNGKALATLFPATAYYALRNLAEAKGKGRSAKSA